MYERLTLSSIKRQLAYRMDGYCNYRTISNKLARKARGQWIIFRSLSPDQQMTTGMYGVSRCSSCGYDYSDCRGEQTTATVNSILVEAYGHRVRIPCDSCNAQFKWNFYQRVGHDVRQFDLAEIQATRFRVESAVQEVD